MKINWGTGLLIAIVVSSLGILILVALSTREKIDLVTEEYYPKELKYEEQIEKLKNTRALKVPIGIEQVPGKISFSFPRLTAVPDSIRGEILFYFPSDKYGDRTEHIRLDSAFSQSFITTDFRSGKYEVIIDWQAPEKAFLQKEVIFLSR